MRMQHVQTNRWARASKRCQQAAAVGKDVALREKHKIFDEASIVVRSGAGGDGEIVQAGKGRMVRNFKYKAGGNMSKQIWLPASPPDDGTAGGDVLLVVDPHVDDLLHLHSKKTWTAPRGANGDPAQGSGGPKRRDRSVQKKAPPLKISVPPGTVVKDNKGRLLAELINVGDVCCVATGGAGGHGVVAPTKERAAKARILQRKRAEEDDFETFEVEDMNWREDAKGQPGQEVKLRLILRVVANVGFVGLPNAGKSSLLQCMTRARPEIANYPFTTLMPNLGVMHVGGDDLRAAQSKVVLADLPGLIEGAHEGKGLGRMFLRHLGRTEMLVHVVDAAADNPAADYWVVREELRMYAPLYCQRPHVVALNKMDLPDAFELQEELVHEIMAMAQTLQAEHPGTHIPPITVHCCSAASNNGINDIMASIATVLEVGKQAGSAAQGADDDIVDDSVLDWDTSLPEDDDEFGTDAHLEPELQDQNVVEDAWQRKGPPQQLGINHDDWLASRPGT